MAPKRTSSIWLNAKSVYTSAHSLPNDRCSSHPRCARAIIAIVHTFEAWTRSCDREVDAAWLKCNRAQMRINQKCIGTAWHFFAFSLFRWNKGTGTKIMLPSREAAYSELIDQDGMPKWTNPNWIQQKANRKQRNFGIEDRMCHRCLSLVQYKSLLTQPKTLTHVRARAPINYDMINL